MLENPTPNDGFQNAIHLYLSDLATKDSLFAQTLEKPNKTLKECCNYIVQEVKKSGRQGFNDPEIFAFAVHYYDEDDIKDIKPNTNVKVVTNYAIEKKATDKKATKKDPIKTKKVIETPKVEEPKIPVKPQKKSSKPIVENQISLF